MHFLGVQALQLSRLATVGGKECSSVAHSIRKGNLAGCPVLYDQGLISSIGAGIPPGCLEGFNFWDYIQPLHSKEEVECWIIKEHTQVLSLSQE